MPKDFKENITVLSGIKDEKLRWFASEIHSKWKSLLRKVDKKCLCEGCESTMLDLPFPFLVPGGRFREYYYWDTFWILEGLYVSEMCLSARSVIENSLWMVGKFGFIPNGSRSYYLNRSQPPMLPKMIERFLERCGSGLKKPEKFLERAIVAIETEYKYWMERRSVRIEINGKIHALSRYSAEMNTPRPESYEHDVKLGQKLESRSLNQSLYHNLATAAESGWDFSGRWIKWNSTGLEDTITSDIIPVDLNSIMFRNEQVISRLYGRLGNKEKEEEFKVAAEKRSDSIKELLYCENLKEWRDYNWATNSSMIERPFYITDICPLWYGPWKEHEVKGVEEILQKHEKLLYEYPGGTPISEKFTGQQWDFPNVWAPTQYGLVKLHLRLWRESGDDKHFKRAVSVAQKWITSTYCGYKHFGYIFEKYNAKVIGQPGAGGEYIVQEGFGWSNGVILWLLEELGPHLKAPHKCPTLPIASKDMKEATDFLTTTLLIITLLLSGTFAIVILAHLLKLRPFGTIQEDEEAPLTHE